MIDSVPVIAAWGPPETGASRWCTPRSISRAAWFWAVAGAIELESMIRAPGRTASATPFAKRRSFRLGPSASIVNTISACAAADLADGARFAPLATTGSIFSAVLFQTVTSHPASSRVIAIGAPISPVPSTATFGLLVAAALIPEAPDAA